MVRITWLGVTLSLWQWIVLGTGVLLIFTKVKSSLWKAIALGVLGLFMWVMNEPLLHRAGHGHELYDSASGLQVALPAQWIQWGAAKLMSPEAKQHEIIAYAGDPKRQATVAVRQFKMFLTPGDLYPISYWSWSGGDSASLDKRFDLLLSIFKDGLQRNIDSMDIQSAEHRGPTPRAFVLALRGNFRERGEGNVWRHYFIILPKGQENILEIRFEVPLEDKATYQTDLDFIEANLQKWIDGQG